ncbi:branched-chain amino acid ABC transporter permease [Virgisporangium aurantiacum]|uniref:Branched-chain amino acid ABC transporter permease n=1 Tax=Virgisporangium aurantiacum TaxID=175570 RepID=A0A8J3Z5Y6_9ACTN|nr:branched-chain amino acid ABC transporter permease [Virgisporangium aurantiacum]GIJ56958.1 branched-chain amino acid ABC transporter permease [Virgisporangium aurantiacum]
MTITAPAYRPTHARLGWRSGGVAIAAVTALAAAPFFLAPYATTTLTRMLVFALLAASLDLLVGFTGLPSLGHAAYFGVGAYAAGWVAIHLTPAAPVPLLAAVVAGALAAAAAGSVAVRTSGVYFLMLTLALAEVIQQVAESWEPVTGGSNGLYGIPAVRIGSQALTNVGYLHWYVLACCLLGVAVLWSLVASPFGATLRGIRDNEPRMRSIGYDPARYKYAAFVAAGAVAGLAGGLLAAQQRLVTPADLGFTTSALALLAVVIGGSGTLWGPCVGAALVILVRDSLGSSLDGHGPLVLGLVFIAVVFAMPRGVAGIRGLPVARRWRAKR